MKFIRFHPDLERDVKITLRLLSQDLNSPKLKTHKLHGKLKDSYSCNINYQYRIVFSYDKNYVYLESIGSHEDVY